MGSIEPQVAIIVAAAENGVIGNNGQLPWDLPDDWAQFLARIQGHPVVMGRRTYEVLGKPFAGSVNVVVTHDTSLKADGVATASSLAEGIVLAEMQQPNAYPVFIIGGEMMYRQALEAGLADRVYLTRVHASPTGDAFFPGLDPNQWRLLSETPHPADDRHAYAFTVQTWVRR